jgi:hypothetical protein
MTIVGGGFTCETACGIKKLEAFSETASAVLSISDTWFEAERGTAADPCTGTISKARLCTSGIFF